MALLHAGENRRRGDTETRLGRVARRRRIDLQIDPRKGSRLGFQPVEHPAGTEIILTGGVEDEAVRRPEEVRLQGEEGALVPTEPVSIRLGGDRLAFEDGGGFARGKPALGREPITGRTLLAQ